MIIIITITIMDKKRILVLSGGSVRGISHIGVLKALEDKNILKNIKIFAGSSVGAIICALYVIGYTPDELNEFVNLINLNLLHDSEIKFDNIFGKYGLNEGENFCTIIHQMFENKSIDPNITFSKLFAITNKELTFTTVCINEKKIYYLNHETYPDMSVLLGLRMTTALPILFTPVCYDNKMFIDGGFMNNYPINLYIKKMSKVIGVYLNVEREITQINNFEDYILSTMDCIFEGYSNSLIGKYENCTIHLKLPNIGITDMNLCSDIKKKLFNIGYENTIEYCNKLK